MKNYTEVDIQKVRELRLTAQYSFNQLHKITRIPLTTLKRWCRDDPRRSKSEMLLLFNNWKRTILKQSEIPRLPKEKIHSSYAKLLLAFLYWCEGSKYPASNALTFVNSDPLLVKIFVTLLRKSYVLNESKFRVRLQIHTTHNYHEIKKYWSELLNIPTSRFIKPTITEKKHKKHRTNYLGTCSLRYQDYRLQLKLIGIYEHVAKNLNDFL